MRKIINKDCRGCLEKGAAFQKTAPLPYMSEELLRKYKCLRGMFFLAVSVAFFPVTSASVKLFKEQISRDGSSRKSQTYDPVVCENAGAVDDDRKTQIYNVSFVRKRDFEVQPQIRILDSQLDVRDKHHNDRNRVQDGSDTYKFNKASGRA